MKKILLVFLGASGMIGEQAQTAAKKMFHLNKRSTDTRQLMLHANYKAMAARNTAASAVTGISSYLVSGNALILSDTGVAYYSHGRTSAFNFSSFDYEVPQMDLDFLETDGNPLSIPVMKVDSAKIYEAGSTQPEAYGIYNYDNNSQVLLQRIYSHNPGVPDTAEYSRISRDAQSRATQIVTGRSTNTYSDTTDFARIYYNAQSRVDRDTTFEENFNAYVPTIVRKFAYKPTGLVDSIMQYTRPAATFKLTSVVKITGTPANLIRSMSSYDIDPLTGARAQTTYDSLAYDPTNSFTIFERHDYYGGNTVAFSRLSRKHLNAGGLPDTVINVLVSNGGSSTYQYVMEYNADRTPSVRREYAINGSTRTLNSVQRYYYNGRTGVDEIATTFGIAIVPNPSNGVFSFRSAAALPQGTTCAVYDLNGRRLGTFAIDEQHASIDISTLNAGIYILQISDASGRISLSRQVEKQ